MLICGRGFFKGLGSGLGSESIYVLVSILCYMSVPSLVSRPLGFTLQINYSMPNISN